MKPEPTRRKAVLNRTDTDNSGLIQQRLERSETLQVLLSMIESYVSVQRFCFKSLYVSTMCLIADMETIPQMKSAGTPEKSRLPVLLGAGMRESNPSGNSLTPRKYSILSISV